jgi:hypothetical protein
LWRRNMPFLSDNDVVKSTIVVDVPAVRAMLPSLHWTQTGHSGSGVTDVEFNAALEALYTVNWYPFISSDLNYAGHMSQRIWPLPITARIKQPFSHGSGTGGLQNLPWQCAMVATFETGLAGKHNRGRFYWGGNARTQINGAPAQWSAAYALTFQVWLNTLLGAKTATGGAGTATYNLTLYQPTTHTSVSVSSITVSTAVGTQKRRGDFRRGTFPPL